MGRERRGHGTHEKDDESVNVDPLASERVGPTTKEQQGGHHHDEGGQTDPNHFR